MLTRAGTTPASTRNDLIVCSGHKLFGLTAFAVLDAERKEGQTATKCGVSSERHQGL